MTTWSSPLDARSGQRTIEEILPRALPVLARRARQVGGMASALSRPTSTRSWSCSPQPARNHTRRIDLIEFLVIAEASELAARIVVNKVGLVDPAPGPRAHRPDYERAGYPVHLTSVRTRTGLEPLHESLAGRTSVVTGPSGVGKSSLLQRRFIRDSKLRVGAIKLVREQEDGTRPSARSRTHCPTAATVWTPPGCEKSVCGDSRSPRSIGVSPSSPRTSGQCRFADCTHLVEPGCAVREAVTQGTVSAARWDSYVKLREEG